MQPSFRTVELPRAPFRFPKSPVTGSVSPARAAQEKPSCDCAHHRRKAARDADSRHGGSIATLLAPVVLCAFCPACIGVWAPLLGIVGWGFGSGEALHGVLLGVAVSISVAVAVARARQPRYWTPLVLTTLGGALLMASHLMGDSLPATLVGIASLLTATYFERRGPLEGQGAAQVIT
jgi:hypothetical protein